MTVSVDMVMDGYYAQDRLQELWKQIESLHLSYLEMEDSPQKMEQRNKLEEYIKQFLCLVPHNQKFIFPETANVLHRSASTKKDFSAYRAAPAWNAIGMYAANLLNQPWRKEYRQIKMYSGFYKHQIDSNLVGAEIMFEAMGYKHEGDRVLILEGPVCPDQVISVSQDSLIAYVECQILKSIWEEVTANFKVSWLEVLEFRESHLCSPQQSVLALNYRFQERQYQQHTRSYSQGTDPFVTTSRCVNNLHCSVPSLPANHSFPPPCYYSNCSNYAPIIPPPCTYSVPLGYNQHVKTPYCYMNGYAPAHSYACPTGHLVEVNPQQPQYDVVDAPSNSNAERRGSVSNSKTVNCDKEESTSEVENWDYVYRNLESLGYSKDLGERGDLLKAANKKLKSAKEVKKTKGFESGISNLSVRDRPIKCTDRVEANSRVEQKLSTRASFNGVVGEMESTNKPESTHHTKSLDIRKSKVHDSDRTKLAKENQRSSADKWECSTCTFLNDAKYGICEMCGKSKVTVQDVMEIGGSQCPKCTLVNPKSCKVCKACDSSLQDSPTYI